MARHFANWRLNVPIAARVKRTRNRGAIELPPDLVERLLAHDLILEQIENVRLGMIVEALLDRMKLSNPERRELLRTLRAEIERRPTE